MEGEKQDGGDEEKGNSSTWEGGCTQSVWWKMNSMMVGSQRIGG